MAGTFAACALAIAIAALVGMAVLLPAAEYAPLSPRGGALEVYQGNRFHYGPFELLTYLSSYPGGDLFEDMRAAGAVALFLAVSAVFSRRRRSMAPVLAALVVSLDLSLGLPLPFSTLLDRFCPFQIMSPSRTMVLTCFPLGLLAGYGVDAVVSACRSRARAAGRSVAQLAVAAPILLAAYAGVIRPHYETVSSALHPVLLMAAPVAAVGVALFSGWFPRLRLLRWGLAGLVVAEVAAWNTFFMPACLTTPPPVFWNFQPRPRRFPCR